MITVKGRILVIPASERQIGTDFDNNSEVRIFCVNRISPGGIDISHLLFHLDLEYAGKQKDTCMLTKEVGEDAILLTWKIEDTSVAIPGTVWVNIRGTDDYGTVKWGSNKGALYVKDTVNTPKNFEGLTELEQIEAFAKNIMETEDGRVKNEAERVEAEKEREETFEELKTDFEDAVKVAKTAKSWAVGETGLREGEDEDNSKYYCEQAKNSKENAEEAAKQAELYAAGLVDRGIYDAAVTYDKGDFVFYKESTWLALQDGLLGVEPVEGDSWKYLAKGIAAELLSLIFATDTQGLLGEAGETVTGQALMDEIADRIANKVMLKTDLVSQIINDSTKAISAAAAYSLQEQITTLNSNLGKYYSGTELTNAMTSSWTDNISMTLPAGVYIIEAQANLAVANVGFVIKLTGPSEIARQSLYTPNANAHSAHLTVVVTLSAETTITVQSWSGTNCNVSGFTLKAIKLK